MRCGYARSKCVARGIAAGVIALILVSQAQSAMVSAEVAQARATSLVSQLTLDEKIGLVTGRFGIAKRGREAPPTSLRGDGFVPGVPRLGIPDLQLVGASLGVTNLGGRANGPSTALPATLAVAASFDEELAYCYGAVVGNESRDQGFNVALGGGVNLARDPRGGRVFEYHGEDPVLAGKLVAAESRGVQDHGVVATIKHFALNDIENGRFGLDVNLDERAMRESELLAFEIAVKESGAGAVMCGYNLVNGIYACESAMLLDKILKHEWGFKGWVMSDWGATHSTSRAANAGLDQEFFRGQWFGDALKAAVEHGEVALGRLDDMVRRILVPLIEVGVLDSDRRIRPINMEEGAALALRAAEEGSVLLKNEDKFLPLNSHRLKSVAVIGLHADKGVLSGGGSSQVSPIGGNALPMTVPSGPLGFLELEVWNPSPPLKYIGEKALEARITYDSGANLASAASVARDADVAIVFAGRHRTEGNDVPDLSLGGNQDELINAVAFANPRTVVVLETGGAVLMPWLHSVRAVLQAWYPGQSGGAAIANLLFGDVNPSGKTPLTFPASEQDLPRPQLPGPPPGSVTNDPFKPVPSSVSYSEGALVGYKWFEVRGKQPLFAFGHGLSYTSFEYSDLSASVGEVPQVAFSLSNTGARAGAEVAQVYVSLPALAAAPERRLAGWARTHLQAGQIRRVSISLEPKALAVWSTQRKRWVIPAGEYRISIGSSSSDLRLNTNTRVAKERILP